MLIWNPPCSNVEQVLQPMEMARSVSMEMLPILLLHLETPRIVTVAFKLNETSSSFILRHLDMPGRHIYGSRL